MTTNDKLAATLDRVPAPDLLAALARRKCHRPAEVAAIVAQVADRHRISVDRLLNHTVQRDLTQPRRDLYRQLDAISASPHEIAHVTGHSYETIRNALTPKPA